MGFPCSWKKIGYVFCEFALFSRFGATYGTFMVTRFEAHFVTFMVAKWSLYRRSCVKEVAWIDLLTFTLQVFGRDLCLQMSAFLLACLRPVPLTQVAMLREVPPPKLAHQVLLPVEV